MTFNGQLKVRNVQIAYSFLMVQDQDVITMKHYWDFQNPPKKTITDLA
jgi:hypothetical protein